MQAEDETPNTLRLLALGAATGSLVMGASIAYALLFGDLSTEGPLLLAMPWGLVSLVDIYLGLLLVSLWVLWREQFSLEGYCWALMILVLGNFISCLYLVKACLRARGSITRLWTGRHYEKYRP